MRGVVVTCWRTAISSPARSPAKRPTDNTRASIGPASVAGKAQGMTCVVCRVVDELGIGKAGQENQAEPEKQGDACGAERLASFCRSNDGSSRTGHLNSPWLPLRQPECIIRRQVSWLSGLRLWPPSRFPSGILAIGFPHYSWGGSRGLGARSPLPRSLLIPVRGTVERVIRAVAKPRQRDSAGRCPALLAPSC